MTGGGSSLTSFRVRIIHVGNMANKGTQALFSSDIDVVKELVGPSAVFSVSTTECYRAGISPDILGSLCLPIDSATPPVLDVPHEKADAMSKRYGFERNSLKYRVFAAFGLVRMLMQAFASTLSIISTKIGLGAFFASDAIEQTKNSDLVISYSDENFKEGASLLPLNFYWIVSWWAMLISRTWEILLAKSFAKPVVMFPNSVGPFRTSVGKFLARFALSKCDCILIREPVSFAILCSLDVAHNKRLTSDTTLLYRANAFCNRESRFFQSPSGPMIGICPGIYSYSLSSKEANEYVSAHVKALDQSIEKYGFRVIFLPHEVTGFSHDDLHVCKLILNRMRHRDNAAIVNVKTVDEFKSLLDRMDMIISSRMHPAVLGVSGYVPVLCIAYDHKQTGFFERLGLTDCILNIREISYETLSSKIDHVWANREIIKGSLAVSIPKLQKDVKNAIKWAISPFIRQCGSESRGDQV